ncbi:MAG: hypothetical protein VCA13_02335 [PS1 clade bacterium]
MPSTLKKYSILPTTCAGQLSWLLQIKKSESQESCCVQLGHSSGMLVSAGFRTLLIFGITSPDLISSTTLSLPNP